MTITKSNIIFYAIALAIWTCLTIVSTIALVPTNVKAPSLQLQQLKPCTDVISHPDGRFVCEIDIYPITTNK